MTDVSCPRCGAPVDLPTGTDESVRCRYCQSVVPATNILPAELVAARHLDASLGARLDQHAARNRRLVLAVGGGIAALVGAVLHRHADPPDYDRACSGRVGAFGPLSS